MAEAHGQRPDSFGIGRLFWLTHEAIVGAALDTARIVLWNPSAERLFGYTPDEAIGMPLDALVPTDFRDRHLAGVRRYLATGRGPLVGGNPVDVPALRRDGGTFDISLTLTDVSEGAGGAHVLAIIRDTTEVKAAQRRLEQTNDAMRGFVAAASHDLRTPLTSLLGFSQALVDHPDVRRADELESFLDGILRNAHRAARLVDDLLTLSQIQASAVPVRTTPVSVADAISATIELSGVAASIEVADDLQVLADLDHLERMLTNYLVNAGRHGRPPVVVRARAVGEHIEVRVTDAGEGVRESFRHRLFTSFARAEQSPEGTGLGLSIVAGLAEANGGEAFYEQDHVRDDLRAAVAATRQPCVVMRSLMAVEDDPDIRFLVHPGFQRNPIPSSPRPGRRSARSA